VSHASGAGHGAPASERVGVRGRSPQVNMEWWDSHWIEDRILRKLREASGS